MTAIPSVSIAQEDGNTLLGRLEQASTVAVAQANYAYYDGTSMATAACRGRGGAGVGLLHERRTHGQPYLHGDATA